MTDAIDAHLARSEDCNGGYYDCTCGLEDARQAVIDAARAFLDKQHGAMYLDLEAALRALDGEGE